MLIAHNSFGVGSAKAHKHAPLRITRECNLKTNFVAAPRARGCRGSLPHPTKVRPRAIHRGGGILRFGLPRGSIHGPRRAHHGRTTRSFGLSLRCCSCPSCEPGRRAASAGRPRGRLTPSAGRGVAAWRRGGVAWRRGMAVWRGGVAWREGGVAWLALAAL